MNEVKSKDPRTELWETPHEIGSADERQLDMTKTMSKLYQIHRVITTSG